MMRVVTYNIHGWRTTDDRPNLDLVASVLADTQADIIGLNEVFYPRVVEGANEPALAALAARLNMQFVFGPCRRWPAQDDLPADAYGNACWRAGLSSPAPAITSRLPGKEQRGLLKPAFSCPTSAPSPPT